MELKFRAWDTRSKGKGKMLFMDPYGESFTGTDLIEEEDWKVMQFTGLRDKNGKEIYEGDIIQHGLFALNDTTKFGPECWTKLPEGVKDDDITSVIAVFAVKWDIPLLEKLRWLTVRNPDVEGCEVIGNIYSNPDLLK